MGKYCRASWAPDDHMVHSMLDTQGYKHTLRISNNYFFFTATIVAQTRLSAVLYVRGRVKNYPQCSYILCSWLHCWLGMMRYLWSTCLLLLWCTCDPDSQFMSWVLCHKFGRSTFHLHQRAEGGDPFFMGWRCTRCRNA
jgi:hypothetical protein